MLPKPDFKQAWIDLNLADCLDPDRVTPKILRAELNILRQKPDFQKAIESLNKAARLNQGQSFESIAQVRIPVLLGLAHFAQGDYHAAKYHFATALSFKDSNDSPMLEHAKNMLLWMSLSPNSPLCRMDNAGISFSAQAGHEEVDANYQTRYNDLQIDLSRQEDNAEYLEQLSRVNSSPGSAAAERGNPRIAYQQGRYYDAITLIDQKLAIATAQVLANPGSKETHSLEADESLPLGEKLTLLLFKAEVELRVGRNRDALVHLNTIIDGAEANLWPQVAEAYLLRAKVHRESSQWVRAKLDAERYLELKKDPLPGPEAKAWGHYIIGLAQLDCSEFKGAAESLSEVLALGEEQIKEAEKDAETIKVSSFACAALEWIYSNVRDRNLLPDASAQTDRIRKFSHQLLKIKG